MHSFKFIVAALSLFSAASFAAPTPVASYGFNNTLASSVGGAPALVEVNPLGTSGFAADVVFGNAQTVYTFNGTPSQNAGLTLDSTGLLTSPTLYTVEIVFKFTENLNAWRRILDVQNRQTDNGFYVDPSNNLDVYPVAGGSPFTNDEYHDVFLVNDNGTVTFYLDGSAQQTVNTAVMNLDPLTNPDDLFGFFLDNIAGPATQEYSSGSVAKINLYNVALTAAEVTPVPEPGSLALLGLGLAGLAAIQKRKPS
jgi:hypothetical protein